MKYRRVKNNSVGNGKKAKEGRWVANEKKNDWKGGACSIRRKMGLL